MGTWDNMLKNRTVKTGMDPDKITACSDLKLYAPRAYVYGEATKSPGDILFTKGPIIMRNTTKDETKFGPSMVFTVTTKMNAFSFSLPAGPLKYWGTCQVPGFEGVSREVLKKPGSAGKFICEGCYAKGGNYGLQPNISIPHMARLVWVLGALADGSFDTQFSLALDKLLAAPTQNVLDVLGMNRHFFRIHDSGDFFNPRLFGIDVPQFAYFDGWLKVIRNFPWVHFWAPTRMWAVPEWREMFSKQDIPSNFSLRPSALWVDARPPEIPGLAAGSGVASVIVHRDRDALGHILPGSKSVLVGVTPKAGEIFGSDWLCPAYFYAGHSCSSANCRKCWTSQEQTVVYPQH